MRLNGWKRIGIVFSVVWLLVGSFWLSGVITDDAARRASIAYQTCTTNKTIGGATAEALSKDCGRAFSETWDSMLGPEVKALTPIGAGAVYALIALLAAWLAFWLVYRVVRWVWAGFARQQPPQAVEAGPRNRTDPQF
jgi:hypothetical protein